jgi:16S rRNA (adenine1518-N6/adenine1519-N6)-dimethyltransferase
MRPAGVRAFLERHGLAAHRALGQNFLVDEGLARRLVDFAGVASEDAVIEIGTGLGILTRALAARARRVVTVEVDAGLVRGLRADGLLPANVELRHADALELDLAALARDLASAAGARSEAQPSGVGLASAAGARSEAQPSGVGLASAAGARSEARAERTSVGRTSVGRTPVRLVANLPYSVASPLLRRLLDLRGLLADWSVMVQREVALRVLAAPGSRDFGSLALLHALTVRVERVLDLHPGCFHPAPRVVSSFVRFVPLATAALEPGELEGVERVARAAFSHRRKTLANALRDVLPAERLAGVIAARGLGPRVRPQEVPPAVWRELARCVATAEEGGVVHGA